MFSSFSLIPPPPYYLDLPGGRIHYNLLGEGPPLVLLHGLGSCTLDWFPVTPGLAPAYRLILVDLRGHGESSRTLEGGYGIKPMSDDVIRVLDELGVERAHLLGLSLGGCVALQLAVKHPARVNRMIVVNSFARLRHQGIRTFVSRLSRLYAALKGMDALARVVATSLFDDPEYQAITYERIRQNDLGVMRQTMLALARFNILDDLKRIQAPTLVLIGDRDRTVSPLCAYDMMARIPRARLRVIADAGHALPYDQPEAFIKHTLEFLGQSPCVVTHQITNEGG